MKIALRKAIEEESLVLYKENAERKKNHSFYTIRCLFVITQTLEEDNGLHISNVSTYT